MINRLEDIEKRPLLSRNVEVKWPNELELRIVIHGVKTLLSELITVNKPRQQDLDFQKHQVEADSASRTYGKRNVCARAPVLNLLGVPTIGVEAEGITPDVRVCMDSVECGHNDAVGRDTVSS
jgi:hypothetical protein